VPNLPFLEIWKRGKEIPNCPMHPLTLHWLQWLLFIQYKVLYYILWHITGCH